MHKTVFISYDFCDKSFMGEVKRWLEQGQLGIITVDEKNLEPESDNQAKARISKQIHESYAI
jgi:hypothetical protein